MSLHEVQIAEGIIYLEYQLYILQEKLDFVMQNCDVSNMDSLNESKLKRDAAKYIKEKYPDADIKFGDWID
jgi:hypothetical protein